MRYHFDKSVRKGSSPLSRLANVLSRIQPFFKKSVSRSAVLSPDQRERLVQKFEEIVGETLDGVSRERGVLTVKEEFLPEREMFDQDDVTLRVRLESMEEEIQYFVSLGLNTIERLYLTNRLGEELYFKYRRVLRFLPRFHGGLIRLYEKSSRN
jgi:hypothetical protein